MKRMFARFLLAGITLAFLALCTAPLWAQQGIVVADSLNARSGPGTTYRIIGKLPENTTLAILGTDQTRSWLYICCLTNGQRAWVSSQYILQPVDKTKLSVYTNDSKPIAPPSPLPTPATRSRVMPTCNKDDCTAPEPTLVDKARIFLPQVGGK